jgi:dihydroxyacetone kinase
MFKSLPSETVDLSSVFREAASVAENSMGGISGAIYAIYINAVASSLVNMERTIVSPSDASVSRCMAIALQGGLEELYKYTLARQGHRTLMDALIPFVETFCKSLDFQEAILAAQKGCEETRMMEATLGRASYVGRDRFVENGGIPDPGALGIVSILKGMQRAL